MSDPLEVTARELIRAADQDRDLARRQAEQLRSQIESLQRQIADLHAELRPSGSLTDEQRLFAERVVGYMWREAINTLHDDDGLDDALERLRRWVEYRVEQWCQRTSTKA